MTHAAWITSTSEKSLEIMCTGRTGWTLLEQKWGVCAVLTPADLAALSVHVHGEGIRRTLQRGTGHPAALHSPALPKGGGTKLTDGIWECCTRNTKSCLTTLKYHSRLQTHPSDLIPPNYTINQILVLPKFIYSWFYPHRPPSPIPRTKYINWKTQVKNVTPTFCTLFQSSFEFFNDQASLFSWANKGSPQIFIK